MLTINNFINDPKYILAICCFYLLKPSEFNPIEIDTDLIINLEEGGKFFTSFDVLNHFLDDFLDIVIECSHSAFENRNDSNTRGNYWTKLNREELKRYWNSYHDGY